MGSSHRELFEVRRRLPSDEIMRGSRAERLVEHLKCADALSLDERNKRENFPTTDGRAEQSQISCSAVEQHRQRADSGRWSNGRNGRIPGIRGTAARREGCVDSSPFGGQSRSPDRSQDRHGLGTTKLRAPSVIDQEQFGKLRPLPSRTDAALVSQQSLEGPDTGQAAQGRCRAQGPGALRVFRLIERSRWRRLHRAAGREDRRGERINSESGLDRDHPPDASRSSQTFSVRPACYCRAL